ncbi:MAG TPA: universal stress protein [Candidatus Acidoferrales bacterium]|nr:universal stress protein [Candidatus Acidoferrales bacterium]
MTSFYLAKFLDTKTHVVNDIHILGFTVVLIDGNFDRIIKLILIEIEKIMQNIMRLFASRGADESKVRVTALQRHYVNKIYVYADTHNTDFITFGIRVRTRLDRLLIGSVADKIIGRDKVPVVVVRGE